MDRADGGQATMRRRIKSTVSILALLVGLPASSILACTCRQRPLLCQAFFDTPEIFSGTVLESVPSTATYRGKSYVSGYGYKFKVDRTFRGTSSSTAKVMTGSGGGDCGYLFEVGSKYIVFAHTSGSGLLGTSICSLTAPWTEELETKVVEQATSKQESGSLFGTVYQRAGKMGANTPMPGVQIVLDPQSRRRPQSTDANGKYSYDAVEPGSHTLEVSAPKGFAVGSSYGSQPTAVAVENVEVSASGCRGTDFFAITNGSVSGQFRDHTGKRFTPEASIPSEIELISADSSDQKTFHSANVNKKDGTFSIDGVPEGRYLLTHNVVLGSSLGNPFIPTYYPGTTRREQASVIVVGRGEAQRELEFRVGPRAELVSFDVKVRSEDESPLENANVWNNHADDSFLRKSATIGMKKTDSAGLATLTGFAGDHEEIGGYWDCPDRKEQLHGNLLVTFNKPMKEPLQLVLRGRCSQK